MKSIMDDNVCKLAHRSFRVIIAVESIESVFAQSPDANHCIYTSKCHKCQCDTEIRITKTSGGYGFLGGILYEPIPTFF